MLLKEARGRKQDPDRDKRYLTLWRLDLEQKTIERMSSAVCHVEGYIER